MNLWEQMQVIAGGVLGLVLGTIIGHLICLSVKEFPPLAIVYIILTYLAYRKLKSM
ncbi:MAG: hypothetical protein WC471_03065 [Candidatus Woesearchaeota archaeon]